MAAVFRARLPKLPVLYGDGQRVNVCEPYATARHGGVSLRIFPRHQVTHVSVCDGSPSGCNYSRTLPSPCIDGKLVLPDVDHLLSVDISAQTNPSFRLLPYARVHNA